MIKTFLKKICHKVYEIGKYEDLRINDIKQAKALSSISEIDTTAWISEEALIYNKSQPANKIRIGANSRIMGQLLIFDFDGEIVIGDDCFIGPDTRIWSSRKISIGNRVLIAHNVNIHDNISHPIDAKLRFEENVAFVKTGVHTNLNIKGSEVSIGNDVWIGFNATILRGVSIGDGAIIGAGAFVTKNIEPWTINVGNPARCIKKIEPNYF